MNDKILQLAIDVFAASPRDFNCVCGKPKKGRFWACAECHRKIELATSYEERSVIFDSINIKKIIGIDEIKRGLMLRKFEQ
jgi:hypothetical protein